MEQEQTNEEQDRCDYCFRNDHNRYFACRRDCRLTLSELKKEIQEVKALQK